MAWAELGDRKDPAVTDDLKALAADAAQPVAKRLGALWSLLEAGVQDDALVAKLAADFPREHPACPIGSDRALEVALITAPEARDASLVRKLDAVAGRVLAKG